MPAYGFAGCYGSCYGSYTNYFSYWTQPPTAYGYGMPMHATPPANVVPVAPGTPPPPPPPPGAKPPEAAIERGAPASVTITLPADAILYANGIRMAQKSAERKFVTPPMEENGRYHYVFTAEIMRDGQMQTETKQVEVWSGATIRVDFGTMAAATARDEAPSLVISPK
jgi:uncharacterized protein (TIGR03000 family)